MENLLFVYNPRSGKAQIRNHLSDIIDTFVKAQYRVQVHPTQRKLDARKQVLDRYGTYDRIVCSGGDGTLNEVVSGVMELEERPMIGYIPSGSTNDFAASILLPKSMKKAAKLAVTGTPYPVDIGKFNKKYFTYIAAFGAFTDVSYLTPQEKKNLLGHQAYLLEGLKKITSIKPYRMRVDYDGKRIEDEFIYGMISNSFSVGGFKGITGKDIVLNDGLFEVTLIRAPKTPIELNYILAVLLGLEEKNELVFTCKASSINITATLNVPWVLDGEYGGAPKRVEIQNLRKAVKMVSGITPK